MDLTQKIEEQTMLYGSDSRRAIGEFVLQEKTHISRYSVQQIADRTYTSKAALVRFAKALGFSGWKEFVKAYVEEQHYQESHYSDIDPNFPFASGDSAGDIMRQMASLQVESLLDTADLMDEANLTAAVKLISRSKRIGLFSMLPNTLLGELFQRRMLTIGRVVEIPSLGGDQGLLADTFGPEDCAILISYSGNSIAREPASLVSDLEQNGVPIIAITSSGDNLLRRHAAYTFSISSRERLYSKISTFATETSILYILNVLFSCYFEQNYEENLDTKLKKARRLEASRVSYISELREETAET